MQKQCKLVRVAVLRLAVWWLCTIWALLVLSRAGASYFRLLRPLRALNVKKLEGSGGMLRQEKIKIRYAEIASEALFGPKKLLEFPHL